MPGNKPKPWTRALAGSAFENPTHGTRPGAGPTGTVTDGALDFVDPDWANHLARF